MENLFVNFDYDIFLQLSIIVLSTVLIAQVVTFILTVIARRIVYKTRTDLDDRIIELFEKPVFYTIILTGIYMALRILFFGEQIKEFTLPFFQTIIILLWSVIIVKFLKLIFEYFAKISRIKFITPHTLPLFLNLSFIVIWVVSVYIMFGVWGINMTAWLASAGVAGIAIGFAAKDTLANLISGVFILTDTPYKIGDWIVLDNGERGRVTHIGIRTTRIKNTDDMEITVPNAIISSATLINESGGEVGKICRVRVPFSVAYGSDIDQVEEIVLNIANKNEHVLKSPQARVRFRLFGASSLDYELLVWIESSAKRGLTVHQLNRAIYKAFNNNNIEIPYTKQDLYIKEIPKK